MTIRQTIEMLKKFKNQDMPLYFDCTHCGKGLELKEAKEVVLVKTYLGKKV